MKEQLIAKFIKILEDPLSLDKALIIAALAHYGQTDKGGNSYIRHPLRVMEKLDSEDEMICGVFHDVVEDTEMTFEDLAELGFTANQIKNIDSVTKRENETYEERINRALQSYVGAKIKKFDIMDNLALWRLKNKNNLQEKDLERFKHYIESLTRLGAI